jgi:hypothetical protein
MIISRSSSCLSILMMHYQMWDEEPPEYGKPPNLGLADEFCLGSWRPVREWSDLGRVHEAVMMYNIKLLFLRIGSTSDVLLLLWSQLQYFGRINLLQFFGRMLLLPSHYLILIRVIICSMVNVG